MRNKSKCGIKDQDYNGLKMEIETLSSFMGQQLRESRKISLKGFKIVKGGGSQRRTFT